MILRKNEEVRYSTSAYHEISKLGLNQQDVLDALENGNETAGRAEGIEEMRLSKKEGLLKVVVAESFDFSSRRPVRVVTHAALIRTPKRR
ncbi:hypothetical protein HY995_01100 [Candidatus Micrarchaeota archaeon]|nr:hypothetical protein [Candidatus Micrarchaeota archaeon]MBI5176665.1 hypothetical protein [Candidatus Micrarchaeota archaeon]